MKYHNVITYVNGIRFSSKLEAARYVELKPLVQAGILLNFQRQVPYQILLNGKKICKYYSDFEYDWKETGVHVIEDAKGYRTKEYKIKKKLVEAQYGIEIEEV